MRGIAVLLLVELTVRSVYTSPITNPLQPDGDVGKVIPEYFDFKRTKNFHLFEPNATIEAFYAHADDLDPNCAIEFKLRWSTPVGSPVYSTPVIFPDRNSGKKNIFVNTYFQQVELLQHDGFKPYGWPISFEDSSFQASPIVYDIDGDGNNDIGIVDKNANLFWVRIGEFGEYLEDYHIQIPKLKVKRDWAKGLDPTFVDSYVVLSMFDHGTGSSSDQTQGQGSGGKKARLDDLKPESVKAFREMTPKHDYDSSDTAGHRRLQETEGVLEDQATIAVDDFVDSYYTAQLIAAQRRQNMEWEEQQDRDVIEVGGIDPEVADYLGDPAVSSEEEYFRAFRGDDGFSYYSNRRYGIMGGMYNDSNYVFIDAHVLATPTLADVNGDGHMEILFPVSYYFDKADYPEGGARRASLGQDLDPDMFVAGGIACWDMETQDWAWLVHLDLTTAKSKFQAMVYSTPTVADLDGDGRTEIILGTALGLLYVLDGESGFTRRFFPMQFHSIQAQVAVSDIMGGPDLEMLVGDMGGTLACVSLSGDVLWDVQLSGSLPFTPTIGDVDGDGVLDVVVIAVTDIEGGDNAKAKAGHRSSKASKGCDVWVVRGDTGATLPGYPIRLPKSAAAASPVLLADLRAFSAVARFEDSAGDNLGSMDAESIEMLKHSFTGGPFEDSVMFPPGVLHGKLNKTMDSHSKIEPKNLKKAGLHMILSSFDGHIYVIDGSSPYIESLTTNSEGVDGSDARGSDKCIQRLDIGEHVYSMPLLDDISGDGFLDMVVGTMNGHVLLFETNVPAHPMNSWKSFPNDRLNGFTHGQIGIFVSETERMRLRQLDIKGGEALTVAFTIHDSRQPIVSGGTQTSTDGDIAEILNKDFNKDIKYSVMISQGTNRLNPLFRHEFTSPGLYRAEVLLPPPQSAQLVISVITEHGLYFEETVDVALSTRFYVWLKYLVISPFVVFSVPLVVKYIQYRIR